MKAVALIVPPGNEERVTRHELTNPNCLPFLRAGVGGDIELVPGFASLELDGRQVDCVAFCNEHGKVSANPLPLNKWATERWHEALPAPGLIGPGGRLMDHLVGTIVIICGDEEFMAEM